MRMTGRPTRFVWPVAAVLWVAGGSLQAAETAKVLRGRRAEAAPRIDGVLDESAWAEADTAVGFPNFDQPDVMAGEETKAGFARNPRGQRSEVSGQKLVRRLDHSPQHSTDLFALGGHFLMFGVGDVSTVVGKVQRGVCLPVFSIGVSQLAHEVRPVSALGPRFAQTAAR